MIEEQQITGLVVKSCFNFLSGKDRGGTLKLSSGEHVYCAYLFHSSEFLLKENVLSLWEPGATLILKGYFDQKLIGKEKERFFVVTK